MCRVYPQAHASRNSSWPLVSVPISPAASLSATTLPRPLLSLAFRFSVSGHSPFWGDLLLLFSPHPLNFPTPPAPTRLPGPLSSHSPSSLRQQPWRLLNPPLKQHRHPRPRTPGPESWGRRLNGPGKGHFWKELSNPLPLLPDSHPKVC